MPKGWGTHMRGTAVPKDPVSEELATTVRDFRNVKLAKELTEMGQPQDRTIDTILSPILHQVGEDLATRIRQTGQAPTANDVDVALARALDRASATQALEAMHGAGRGPQPNTTADVTAMAQAAVQIHKGTADTALELAEAERERRLEAEDNLGTAAAQARHEEREKAQAQIDFVRESATEIRSLMKEVYEERLAAKDAQLQAAVERTEKLVSDTVAKISGAYDHKISEIEHRHELEKLNIHQSHEIEKLQLQQQQAPRGKTPQDIVNEAWAETTAEDLKEKAKLERQKLAQQIDNEAKTGELLEEALKAVPHVAGTVANVLLGSGTAAPRHGIPGTPPDPATQGGIA